MLSSILRKLSAIIDKYPKVDYADNFPDLPVKKSNSIIIRINPQDYAIINDSDNLDVSEVAEILKTRKLSITDKDITIPIAFNLTWQKD